MVSQPRKNGKEGDGDRDRTEGRKTTQWQVPIN